MFRLLKKLKYDLEEEREIAEAVEENQKKRLESITQVFGSY